MKTLQTSIMAHPSRSGYIPYLLERLGHSTPVIYDQKQNIWDTCRRAWLAGLEAARESGATHVVVIQDDALVCKNFRERAEGFIAAHPGAHIYSFYAGKMLATRIREAVRKQRDYVESSFIFNEVALALSVDQIERMIAFCDEREAQTDQYITKWAKIARFSILYSVPSFIDHRDEESLFEKNYGRAHHAAPRKAFLYAGEQ